MRWRVVGACIGTLIGSVGCAPAEMPSPTGTDDAGRGADAAVRADAGSRGEDGDETDGGRELESGDDAARPPPPPPPPPPPGLLRSIAVMGDSNSDEYRADDNRGGAYAETTLCWVELLERYRGLSFGAWGSRPEPRRSGYEHNWARSGATASSLVSTGQHTGVAAQIAAGDVSFVIMYIGTNDFGRRRYQEIYDGSLSDAALDVKIRGIIADVTEAVDTVMAAGPEGMLIVDMHDHAVDLEGTDEYPDATRRARVTDAVRRVNDGIYALAARHGVAVARNSDVVEALVTRVDLGAGAIRVGDELIRVGRGNEPHHLRLDDSAGHGGTVANGLLANIMFIDVVTDFYGVTLEPFSDAEILHNAGIR